MMEYKYGRKSTCATTTHTGVCMGRYNIIFGTKKKSGAFNKSYISLDDGTNIINILTESQ